MRVHDFTLEVQVATLQMERERLFQHLIDFANRIDFLETLLAQHGIVEGNLSYPGEQYSSLETTGSPVS